MNSFNSLSAMTGMPSGQKKKPTRRGRKPSGKPGASHHAAMNQAYAAGDHAKAKSHALNFAKALHTHMTGAVQPDAAIADPADQGMSPAPAAMPAAKPPAPKPGMGQLAAMLRRK